MEPEALLTEPDADAVQADTAGEPSAADTLDLVDADLRAVEAALAQIDAGSYGRCEVCGGDIDPDVLSAAPLTRACAAHAVG
jgi:RNA polymerase-binding transcription factor DksA